MPQRLNATPKPTPSARRAGVPPRRSRVLAIAALAVVAIVAALSPAASAGSAGPTTPTGLQVSATTGTSVTLTWLPSQQGVVGYDLYRDSIVAGTVSKANFTYNNLACGKSYVLGVDAYDRQGRKSPAATVVAPTSPCVDIQPPTAPSGIAQIAKTSTSATIGWLPSSDNVGVAGYGIYVGGVRIGQSAQTSYTISSLACGSATTVSLDAYDAAANHSTQTSYVVATSSCGDTQPPTAPTDLNQIGGTETSISLAWSPSTDDVGVAYYGVRVNGPEVGTTSGTTYTATTYFRPSYPSS